MKYEFDPATGFLVTKALKKLQVAQPKQEIKIDASQKNSNNKITNNYKTAKQASKPRTVKEKPQKKEVVKTAQSSQYNRYQMDKPKGVETYNKNRDMKSDNIAMAEDKREQKTQTKKLEEIRKGLKGSRGGGSGNIMTSLFGGLGRYIPQLLGGVLGGTAATKILKSGLGKLAIIPTLIYKKFDSYSKELERLAEEQNIDVSELGLTDRFNAITNMFGEGIISFLNAIGLDYYSKGDWRKGTQKVIEEISSSFENFKASYPALGEALSKTFTVVNGFLGDAMELSESGIKKIIDHAKEAFREKDEIEKKFLAAKSKREDAESVVQMTGDGTINGIRLVSKKEVARRNELLEKAKAEEAEAAKKMLNSNGTKTVKTEAEAVMAANRSAVEKNEQIEVRNAQKIEKISNLSTKSEKLKESIENVEKGQEAYKKLIEKDDKYKTEYEEILAQLTEAHKKHTNELQEVLEQLKNIKMENVSSPEYDVSSQTAASSVVSGSTTGYEPLLDTIAYGEGTDDTTAKAKGYNSGYDVTFGHGAYVDDKSKPITSMTMGEVDALQTKILNNPKNTSNASPAGRYQIVRETRRRLQKKLGWSDDMLFDQKAQDIMAMELLKEQGLLQYEKGLIGGNKFQTGVSAIWDSVAKDETGLNYRNTHRARITNAQIDSAISKVKIKPVQKATAKSVVTSTSKPKGADSATTAKENTVNKQAAQTVKIDTTNLDFSIGKIAEASDKILKSVNGMKVNQKTEQSTETIVVNLENKSTGGTIGSQV